MTRDGKIVLIHQERIPIRTAIWEMPSGQIDGPTEETAEQVALRELREEAGYELAKGGELIALGHYFTSPGFRMNAVISFWHALCRSAARHPPEMKKNRFSIVVNLG